MFSSPLFVTTFFALSVAAHAKIGTEKVTQGFERPLGAGVPKGVHGKIWVMEQGGRVWIVDEKTRSALK